MYAKSYFHRIGESLGAVSDFFLFLCIKGFIIFLPKVLIFIRKCLHQSPQKWNPQFFKSFFSLIKSNPLV